MAKQTDLTLLTALLTVLAVTIFIELIYIRYVGEPVPAPNIPRQETSLGQGKELRYAVMGDSTVISQGSDYGDGYAMASAQYLAQNYSVKFINTGVSGATTRTVLTEQLPKAKAFNPDIVLMAVGANDATKFTSKSSIKDSAQEIIDELKRANPQVKIIVTGSPSMDAVSRFPFISKLVMNIRTKQINQTYQEVIDKNNLTLAPIASKTRDAFLKDPSLFAADKFHPNARGYALWVPVINEALDKAL